MDAANLVTTVQISQRTGNLQNAMISAGGKMHLLTRIAQKLETCGIRLRDLLYQFCLTIGVGHRGFQTER